jgi:rsbT antagonist protein RsbS
LEQIPILKLGDFLLVTIQTELHDELAMALQDDLTNKLAKTGARGLLIDISGLEIVDSFIGRSLAQIAGIARVMDAATVLVGMRPAVAITLVELGMTLPDIKTALDVDKGMLVLRDSLGLPGGASSSP